jgi:hypothetical protein
VSRWVRGRTQSNERIFNFFFRGEFLFSLAEFL